LLYQHLGSYRYVDIPSWFHEGFATFVSDGGGAQQVTASEARAAIRSGKHFMPLEEAGIKDMLFPKYASYWGLKHHMFYRQSMLFVAYLKERDEEKYKKFLLEIHEGRCFAESFHEAFGEDISAMWEQFKTSLDSAT